MSALIGKLYGASNKVVAEVWSSRGGVEISVDSASVSLDPIAARNYAALLARASEEVERMRNKSDRLEGP